MENMYELFEVQLNACQPITEEMLYSMRRNTYDSGHPIQIGDKILFAIIGSYRMGDDGIEYILEYIQLCDRDFDLYEPDIKHTGLKSVLPRIKRKESLVSNI